MRHLPLLLALAAAFLVVACGMSIGLPSPTAQVTLIAIGLALVCIVASLYLLVLNGAPL